MKDRAYDVIFNDAAHTTEWVVVCALIEVLVIMHHCCPLRAICLRYQTSS
jgi:hypothetical protein